jgi:hypothetical protein
MKIIKKFYIYISHSFNIFKYINFFLFLFYLFFIIKVTFNVFFYTINNYIGLKIFIFIVFNIK